MTKFTRVLTLATATALLATSLVGCSSDKAATNGADKVAVNVNLEGYPLVDQPITLQAFAFGEPGGGDWKDFPVFQALNEKTGINVEFQTVSGDGAEEKLNLTLASNQLPDVFFSGLSDTMINKYAKMGLFLPLEDLIDQYAPNIKALLEERPEVRQAITMPDGHIYAIPAINGNLDGNVPTKLYLNKTWLDKLGLEVPKTTDEFKAVLEAFKTQDPNGNGQADEIPFTYEPTPPYNVWNGDTGLSGAFGVTDSTANLMLRDGEIIFVGTDEGYKDYIKWTRDLYTNNLIDAEIFTQDHNQYMAKRGSDYVGAYLTHGPADGTATEWIAIEPLKGPEGHQLWSQFEHGIDKNRAIISATNQYPEATMRYIDSFFEVENSLNLRYGKTLVEAGDGKYEVITLEPGVQTEAPGPYVPTLETQERINEYLVQTESQIASQERYAMYEPYLADALPIFNFTAEESKELSAMATDIRNFVSEKKAKWTTGQADIDAEWDSYVETLNKMGLERYMEIYRTAYERSLEQQ
ncbi:extracellular solute-binding protein [Zhenhengia yiwuensis]|uniref:extracellular solute-binding protein n=1 Tax=Zhenhengia yiwuensis TaxID=2763666 RepID=UPI002A757E9C|nr:extracellular solute-binding protein [Zhenhengia yiwuensis]MDY3367042.1 extracellular solute-binding protein [Zhenhengia yiwuensis]